MKKITLLVLLFAGTYTFAQQAPIAIVSASGATKLTSTLDSAALLAQDNDIIYLPGGTTAGQSVLFFTKKVTVIGVGHNPDSTVATGRTFINGNIGFSHGGAEGSLLDGVYVSGDVYFSSNCKIYRTNANNISPYYNWPISNNVLVSQSVARVNLTNGSNGSNGSWSNCKIENTIIGYINSSNFSAGHKNSIFENCIFLTQDDYDIDAAFQCNFRNCTFTGITSWTGSGSNSFFQNCIFGPAGIPPLTDPANAINNYINQTAAATFVTEPTATYSYSNDYQIKTSSPGHIGGTDGKDVGIFGGSTPWVKGNIPPNPHIRTKNVDATTGAGGTLRVRFNVSTQ